MTTKLTLEEQDAILYWPKVAKIPIIPCDSKTKHVNFTGWSSIDFSQVDFDRLLQSGEYDQGIALVLGKTLLPSSNDYRYSFALDFDGLDAVLEWFGNWDRVLELSKKTRIEWHQNKGRIHLIFLSKRPIANNKEKIKIKDSALEVRCENRLLFASPNIHGDGNRWTPLGTNEIAILDENQLLRLEAKIDSLCQGSYMSDENKGKYTEWLENPRTIIREGEGRHNAILFLGCSYFYRYKDGWKDYTDEQRRDKLQEWNVQHCIPIYPEKEFNNIWKWIVDQHRRNRDNQFEEYNSKSKHNNDAVAAAEEELYKIVRITETLIEKYNFKTMQDTEEIYYYDQTLGIYLNHGDAIIKKECEIEDPLIETKDVTEVTNKIIRRTLTQRDEFNKDIEWVACKNCMINLKTSQTMPHDPSFMATVQIPVNYYYDDDKNSSFITDFFKWVETPCPRIMKFLHEVMVGDDDIETVLDAIAYSLWRDLPFHRYLLFNGSGRNGKSTLLYVISRLLGRDNVAGESLQRLLDNRFAAAELYGKLVNIDTDLSSEALSNTGILKKLTGDDYIPAEKKFKNPFKFVSYAKLWFSANTTPQTPDESDAFFARLIIINFPRQFLGENADPDLKYKLTTDSELSGLLKLVVKRLPRVLEKGIHTTSSSIGENYTKYIESSDPVRAFGETCLVYDAGSSPSKKEVYEAYWNFCTYKKLPCESEQSFSRKLKKTFSFGDYQARPGPGEPRQFYWQSIKVIDWKAVEDKEQETLDKLR